MSPYRLGGAIAAAILLIMLVLTVLAWSRYTGIVTPSVSVVPDIGTSGKRITDDTQSSKATADVLAARTRIQSDEINRHPSDFPPITGEESLEFKAGSSGGETLVRIWQKTGDGGGIATPSQDVAGLTSLPYRETQVFEQPEGRAWRSQRNGPLRFGGGWLIFGVALALALFLFGRGRVKIAEGRSGDTVLRFNVVERANHWMTATAFVTMALTGLVILYGKYLLLPLIGEYALGRAAWWSAWLHMSAAIPFVLGVFIMAALWMRENLLTKLDVEWLKHFGGFLNDSSEKPSARRFNAGQKLVFWLVVLGGIAALVTGIPLMLPFQFLGYDGMQWAQLLHAAVGLGMIALILGHIYIGTVGMEGAIDAMWSGRVDRNWAREHHDLWYDKLDGKTQGETRQHPAE